MTQSIGLFATLDAIADAMSAAQIILGALAALQVATFAGVALLLRGAGRAKIETLAGDPMMQIAGDVPNAPRACICFERKAECDCAPFNFRGRACPRACDCEGNKRLRALSDAPIYCICPVRR